MDFLEERKKLAQHQAEMLISVEQSELDALADAMVAADRIFVSDVYKRQLLNHMLNPAHIRGIEFVDLQNAQLLFHFSSSAHALLIA